MQQTQQTIIQRRTNSESAYQPVYSSHQHSTQSRKQSVRVLVVVQDSTISRGLEESLPTSFECLASSSGFAALDLIEMWKPHVIVIDSRISDILYDALCAQIRCSKYMASTPIIVLSRRRGLFEKYRCVEAGASEYIQMPIASNTLANRVMRTCSEQGIRSSY